MFRFRMGFYGALALPLAWVVCCEWSLWQATAGHPLRPEAALAGRDGAHWVDTERGPMAAGTHPLTAGDRTLDARLLPGDALLRVDYSAVYAAEVAAHIAAAAAPGTVFIYEVSRRGVAQPVALFVQTGYRFTFGFNAVGAYWQASPWLAGVGLFLGVVLLLILWPLLRISGGGGRWVAGVVVLGGAVCTALLLRHLAASLRPTPDVGGEMAFVVAFAALWPGLGAAFVGTRLRGGLPWALAAGGLWLAGRGAWLLWGTGTFGRAAPAFEAGVLGLGCLAMAAYGMAGGGRRHWGIGVASAVAVLLACGHAGALVMPQGLRPVVAEHLRMASLACVAYPMLAASASQIAFGKVSLVLTGTLQYLLAAAACVAGYLALGQVYGGLLPGSPYRELLTLLTLLALAPAVWALYRGQAPRLRRYAISSQALRRAQFLAFVARIPQYTDAERLLEDLQAAIRSTFGVEYMAVYGTGSLAALPRPAWVAALPEALHAPLAAAAAPWSANKELSALRLDAPAEQALLASPVVLMYALTVEGDTRGLLMLGRKKRGVFNIEDLDLLAQLIRQTQLTLSVLQLIQRQTDLLRQTYEANLTALRAQINPHFLFNTLNTISALIQDAPRQAEEAVEKLAFIFRHTLRNSTRQMIAVEEEMRLVSAYLDIEQLRFGARLRVEMAVAPEAGEMHMPALLLQTFVENCIKHGVAKIVGPGLVRIHAHCTAQGRLHIEVEDNGPGIDLRRLRASTGLSNVLDRLQSVYGTTDCIVFENTGSGTRIRLDLPPVPPA